MISLKQSLNHLIARNYDAERGYETVVDQLENKNLKTALNRSIKERYRFGHDIKAIMKNLNFEIEKGTSTEGDIHRAWLKIRETFSSNSEETIITEALRGERFAKDAYEEVLNRDDLDRGHRDILMNHLDSIKNTIRDLERIEESLAVTA